jgi:phenylalanyl-tRNA synthetase beta chain
MLISLNWIRDFVDLPADIDPQVLAERFTMTTAEVEGVEHVTCKAKGLVAGEIEDVDPIGGPQNLYAVRVNTGGQRFDSVTAAENLHKGDKVIFAPPGAHLPEVGEVTERQTSTGHTSAGMIVSGDLLGLPTVGQQAMWLPPRTEAGVPIDLDEFDDWVIEVDNKSITHRPDLWGHYGIAREIAAIYKRDLQPYPVVLRQELEEIDRPAVPIEIDNAEKCPRYTGLRFSGVRRQPAPLWMQVRLAHVGLRPIDILVDLTNYIMVELGQPMHAFDAANVDRIEVAEAKPGEKFTTLDGMERTMPKGALMIQSHRKSVALAGIMGGADTEITEDTTDLLLESANFEPAVIRRCATALGHRTDASARFEKSLDPHNTVLAIQRFVHLARPELPEMTLTSKLSDAFPHRPEPTVVQVDPKFVSRYLGRPVPVEEIISILTPLEFGVRQEGEVLEVAVPTFRATKDVGIEADIIEEVARFIGYDSIDPVMPEVTTRYADPDRNAQLANKTLDLFCGGMGYAEIHRYIWFDNNWLKTLDYDPGPTITLQNPAAFGLERLRTTLMPGILSAVELNRRHIDSFELIEIGSVFYPKESTDPADAQDQHLGLAMVAPGRKAVHEENLLRRLKSDLETYAYQVCGEPLRYAPGVSEAPWEHADKTAAVNLDGQNIGRITAVPSEFKRRIDEHLQAWSIVLAEINLSALADRPVQVRKLVPVPVYPAVDVDFSFLADARRRYTEIEDILRKYDYELLRRLAFVDSYEGGSVPSGQRSFTFRATIADPTRTLTEEDVQGFRNSFLEYLNVHQFQLRG